MAGLWAGIDAGKRTHYCVVIDASGDVVLSRKVVNDEASLLGLIAEVLGLAQGAEVCWATDLADGGAALLLALLGAQGQEVLYLSGRIVHHAAATYRGDGKTDAKDARIIADQARMRSDLQPAPAPDEVAVSLRLLTSHRLDVVHDRVRAINRLRAILLGSFPALERSVTSRRVV
jgi:transposase